MIYELKNCRNGEKCEKPSTVEITLKDGVVDFYFRCEDTKYYCPFNYYNGIHSTGDACEILIGTDPERKVYYELEMSAEGLLMLAKMTNHGLDEKGNPILDIGFVEKPFFESEFIKTEKGYDSHFRIKLSDINTGEGEVYFNAFRLETDGGVINKYLYALNPTFVPKFHITEKFLWLKDYAD